jgi:hypothetical protein
MALIPPLSAYGFQNFDHFFPFKDTTLGMAEPSSALHHSEYYPIALSIE